jgi:hypothetical protein
MVILLLLLMSTSRQIEGLLNTGLGIAKNDREKPLYIALKTLSQANSSTSES